MSTITGVSPHAMHIASPPPNAEQIGVVLRDPQKNAFAPVEQAEAGTKAKNSSGEEPGRQSERLVDRELQSTYSNRARTNARSDNRPPEKAIQPDPAPESRQTVSAEPDRTAEQQLAGQVTESENTTRLRVENTETRPEPSLSSSEKSAVAPDRQEVVADRVESRRAQAELRQDQQEIAALKQRDREVKNHEQAHKAVGGQYAGAMSFQYERGPDGARYAVGGEVQIDLSRSANNPQADLQQAQQVRQAALAPAEPSPQDRAIAANATQLILDAQERIRQADQAAIDGQQQDGDESKQVAESDTAASEEARKKEQDKAEAAAERTKEQLAELLESTREASDRILEIHQIEEHRRTLGKLIDFQV